MTIAELVKAGSRGFVVAIWLSCDRESEQWRAKHDHPSIKLEKVQFWFLNESECPKPNSWNAAQKPQNRYVWGINKDGVLELSDLTINPTDCHQHNRMMELTKTLATDILKLIS